MPLKGPAAAGTNGDPAAVAFFGLEDSQKSGWSGVRGKLEREAGVEQNTRMRDGDMADLWHSLRRKG